MPDWIATLARLRAAADATRAADDGTPDRHAAATLAAARYRDELNEFAHDLLVWVEQTVGG